VRFSTLGELLEAPPVHLGESDWYSVDAASVAAFAAATGSGQSDGLVPAWMVLSLTNRLLPELLEVPAASSGVNYGADLVRFGPAVPAGSRLRAEARLIAAEPAGGGVQTTVRVTVRVQSLAEPACVVDSLSRWLP
jgi:acyl dehydratase